MVELCRREGLGGLYAGLQVKAAQTVLAAAILFTTKEKTTQLVNAMLRGAARAGARGGKGRGSAELR